MAQAELILSSENRIYFESIPHATDNLADDSAEKLQEWFSQPFPHGLLKLGISEFTDLPPGFSFWQDYSRLFIAEVCKNPELTDVKVPSSEKLRSIVEQAPFFKGSEYLTAASLTEIWLSLKEELIQELAETKKSLQEYLYLYNPRLNLLGRVCFHLAENKNNPDKPFAFVATYTTQMRAGENAQHLPLKRALQDYAGEKNREGLLALLRPVQKAAENNLFVKSLVDSGRIFQALPWSASDAYQFLKGIPEIEEAGVMIKVPNWWSSKNPPRPQVSVDIGKKPASMMGLDTLLDFDLSLTLNNGETLSEEEWRFLLSSNENFLKVKGQWVEVDRDKLQSVLAHWEKIKGLTGEGISFIEGMRLLAGSGGMASVENEISDAVIEWSNVSAGSWLGKMIDELKNPKKLQDSLNKILKTHLKATLRAYQMAGVSWLWFLYQLKLGGCLADDMGLGKTIQVLSFLLLTKFHSGAKQKPHLLIVPASLLGNWQGEIAKFAPDLSYSILHGSINKEALLAENKEQIKNFDLIITTYNFAHRLHWLKEVEWDTVILDEAQTIKNPASKQTQGVKLLKSRVRFTLTGTPIENRLSDLWSLFDFTSPGLLGNARSFGTYEKNANSSFAGSVRQLITPYILRRLKTDKKIITDLPDKTEIQTFCNLSKQQIQLYEQSVQELKKQLDVAEGMKRRGLVLSYLMRFKQICNHPSQWLGYGEFQIEASGKLMRLRDICDEIAARQEKVLVFTQFKEIIPALAAVLSNIFGQKGLTLDGSTSVKKRTELVRNFQEDHGSPFFILSLKAGGTGLTLTRASHVIHFDRWWNPAVENQATDRAYRIGQKHPVMVHKFISRGTIEEKIDALITTKKELSAEILQGGNELNFTELSNSELLDMISLDIHRAIGEE